MKWCWYGCRLNNADSDHCVSDTSNLILDILALLGGGRGSALNELTPHMLGSLFWGSLSSYLILANRGKRTFTDVLLISSFVLLFIGEVSLFISALVVAKNIIVAPGVTSILAPLEKGVCTAGRLVLSAAFLQFLLRQRQLTTRYLWAAACLTTLLMFYEQLPLWLSLLGDGTGMAKLYTVPSPWVSYGPVILLLVFATYKMLTSMRQVRWPIVAAMSCLVIETLLALVVEQANVHLGPILDPIRGNLQLWAIPLIAYVALRVRHLEGRRREHGIEASERLEALGQLSSGIAHDFNNHLQIILGYTELAKGSNILSAKQQIPLDRIEEAAESAGALVNQLLAFSRGQPAKFEPIDLNEVITRLTPMLSRLLGSDIKLIHDLDLNVQKINADSHMLEQIIINLVVNAKDAIKHSGVISLQSRAVSAQEKSQHNGEPGTTRTQLLVADTGMGMDEKTVRRVFEPFFTTKPIGQGTGLGLATVYSAVQKHNGNVFIRSEPNLHTRVYIDFPVCDEPTSHLPLADKPAAIKSSLGETVLLAEDETAIRDLAYTLLSSAGYNVLIARDGQHAINILQTYKSTINLCVFDVSMPVLNGYDTYDRVAQTHPQIPVLFITGNTSRVAHVRGNLPHLQKPFSKSSLFRMIRNILDKEPVQ